MKNEIKLIVESYCFGVAELEHAPDVMAEALSLLIDRDEIQDESISLSENLKIIVSVADDVLKSKNKLVSKILPTPASTPQARAEGRWWWFLNEEQP